MAVTIQADENGALLIPPGSGIEPGARFSVEPRGDLLILRREPAASPDQSDGTAAKIARLREWIATLPPSPPLPIEATSRDSIYE